MMVNKRIKVGDFEISEDTPVFIIAEAGVNHCGDIDIAKRLIDIASKSGANAVKFQAFKTDHLILRGVEKAPYQKQNCDIKESQFDMLKKLEITKEQNRELKKYCDEKDIIFLTTPFDEMSLDELDTIDLAAYKIASTDITNLLFLKRVAQKGKPVFLSTGMSYFSEVEIALKEMYPYNKDIVLLQCTANYPIRDDEANLSVINTYKSYFDIFVGYSDHTIGIGAGPYAVAMGAKVIEKHFTMDKTLGGPDHKASLSPAELKEFVKQIRKVEEYMGKPTKVPALSEIKTRQSLQKCLVASKDIRKGEIFTMENIIAKRTGGKGVSPIYYHDFIGKIADRDYKIDEVLEL